MPKPKDTLSNESTNEKKKAPTGLGWASKLMGKAADKLANHAIYGDMKSYKPDKVQPPPLNSVFGPGGMDNRPLSSVSMPFVSPDSGRTHQIHGFHLPAQAGKPTVVFFGGTDMDRKDATYQTLIQNMANQAKANGSGLLVMDYPKNANEGKIHSYVDQLQDHLAGQMNVPKNQQAYAGYSLGGNPALYAARTNPDAAGLHLTSTVSSIRQESKNAMAAAGRITKIADKGQLSALMDNIDETRKLIETQQNRVGGPMPVNIVYSAHERFGEAGNKHMAPLVNEFNNYPGGANVVVDQTNYGDDIEHHSTILDEPTHLTSLNQFVQLADQSIQIRLNPPVPAVDVADLDPDTESLTTSTDSLTTSTDDTTSLIEGDEFEEDVDLEALGFEFDDDDDIAVDSQKADSPVVAPSVPDVSSLRDSSSSFSSDEESESEEEEVDFEALGMEFDDDDDIAVDSQKAESPAVSSVDSLRDSANSDSDDISESEEEEIDNNGISFEPDEEEVDVDSQRMDPRGADVEEEFDDFELDLDQEQQPGRDLLPHQAPEGPQEMKPLGQKYVDGEKNQPSRTTEVDGNEVSVKEKEWLRQMSNEAGRDFSPEQWAEMKNAGTTLYMDDDQRQEAKVGFANQDLSDAALKTEAVAVTDQDGRDLDGKNIFVMDQEGQMFAYNEADSTKALKEDKAPGLDGNVPGKQVHVHHSSFLAGEDVAAAGEFVVGTNDVLRDQPLDQETADDLGVDAKTVDVSVLKEVNNRSGHYMPGAQQALQSLDQFANQGVNLDNTKFTLHRSDADGGPAVVDGMAKEFTQGRATAEELQNAAGNEELTTKLKGAAEQTFVNRHQVMAELKQGLPTLKPIDPSALDGDDNEPVLDLDDIEEEVDVREFVEQKQENKTASYAAPGDDDDDDFTLDVDSDDEELEMEEEITEEVEVTEAIEQKQDDKPTSYSVPGDDDNSSPDLDSDDEDLSMEEEVSEEIDVKEGEAVEGLDKDQKQKQSAPEVSGPAEDGPAKAPSVRDSLRASSQKAGGDFQQAVKPNSLRANMKTEIGAQRAQASAPKVGGPG